MLYYLLVCMKIQLDIIQYRKQQSYLLYDYTNYDKECWSDGKKEKLPFSFIVVGTGIGSCITIVCTENNDSKDITDIDSW